MLSLCIILYIVLSSYILKHFPILVCAHVDYVCLYINVVVLFVCNQQVGSNDSNRTEIDGHKSNI